MTGLQQPVRAVARVARDRPADEQPVLLAARRPDHMGPVHLTQLLLVEVAIVGVLVAQMHGPAAAVTAVAGGALLTTLALGRQGGRWWLEHLLIRRQHQRRQRLRPAHRPGDNRLAALHPLAPGLAVTDVPVTDGSQVGVAQDDAGWFAAAACPEGEPGQRLSLDTLVTALRGSGQPGATLQVVWHTVPAPSFEVDPHTAVGRSYSELLAGFGAIPVPMDRVTWVAVRLDALTLAKLGATGAELATAPTVVAGLLRNVAKSLRHAGGTCQVLDASGLADALARSCDLEPHRPGAALPDPKEEWTCWHSARLAHRSFWIEQWPVPEHAASALDRLAATPAATTNVAVTLRPDDNGLVEMRGLVRVSAPAAALAGVCRQLTADSARAGTVLTPLDGEQGPAVYATAPTGGGPR